MCFYVCVCVCACEFSKLIARGMNGSQMGYAASTLNTNIHMYICVYLHTDVYEQQCRSQNEQLAVGIQPFGRTLTNFHKWY